MKIQPGTLDKDAVKKIRARFDQLKQRRAPFEGAWLQISQWVDPRHDFSLDKAHGATRRRLMVDTTAPDSAERMSALLHGFMISPYEPWLTPIARRLGREPTFAERLWLEQVETDIHGFLSSTRSTFRSQSIESVLSDVTYGTSVLYTGRSARTGLPYTKALPLNECWISENDEGVVDTLYREFEMELRSALQFAPTKGLKDKAEAPAADMSEMIRFLWVVNPREVTRFSGPAMGAAKPWSSIILCLSTSDEVARNEGYDRFPFAVTRYSKRVGEEYGRAPGWKVLPVAKFLNAMMETVMRSAEQEADPSLMDLTGAFDTLDTRPGALNSLASADLGLLDPKELVQRVLPQTNMAPATDLIRDARRMIQEMFFIDWMSMGDGAHVTAEFVRDRRDLRLRGLSPVVARIEQEKLSPVGEFTFANMQAADMLAPPPRTLAGLDIEFDYNSPLARVQKQGRVESAMMALQLAATAREMDADAIHEIDVPAILRSAVSDAGLPAKYKRSPEDAARRRQADREAQAEEREAALAVQQGQAAQSGGQAVASMAGAGV
jgi:hypothetical protein